MTLTPQDSSAANFRRALAQYATGVTVVTTRASDGSPVGMTANSFSSVSLDPPLVLWSLARSAQSYGVFRACPEFRVHVLAADQLDIATRFAQRGGNKFETGDWVLDKSPGAWGKLPQLTQCVAWFHCLNRSQYEEGDHLILVGRVQDFAQTGGNPLIFHDGRYVTDLTEEPLPPDLAAPR